MENPEFRVIGPPGCGKTTWIAREVREAVTRFGAGAVLLTSLTRAAAQEMTGRDLPLPKEQIGTLHSHCYRATGRPTLAESRLVAWNAENPDYRLRTGNVIQRIEDGDQETTTEQGSERQPGEALYEEYTIARVSMSPRAEWPFAVEQFAQKWEHFKQRNGLADFTDLIERAYQSITLAPGDPSIIYVDEAQDHSPLELALLRKWSRHTERMVIVGDPDQAIYTWRGADPTAFQNPPVAVGQRAVLSQSYRVPAAVHQKATAWIQLIEDREHAPYRPRLDSRSGRTAEGEYQRSTLRWNDPGGIGAEIEKHTAAGKTVMILTACSYMLADIIAELRSAGVPFWNPFRRKNGAWNPLRQATAGQKTTIDRMLAFLRPTAVWSPDERRRWNDTDLKDFLHLLRANEILRHGALAEIKRTVSPYAIEMSALTQWFKPEALQTLIRACQDGNLNHLVELARPNKRAVMSYPAAVFARYGRAGVEQPPPVIVGTIHSVKGAEADVVYLIPDLSSVGFKAFHSGGESRASIVRQFYVGMTRARESLFICEPGTRKYPHEL